MKAKKDKANLPGLFRLLAVAFGVCSLLMVPMLAGKGCYGSAFLSVFIGVFATVFGCRTKEYDVGEGETKRKVNRYK